MIAGKGFVGQSTSRSENISGSWKSCINNEKCFLLSLRLEGEEILKNRCVCRPPSGKV